MSGLTNMVNYLVPAAGTTHAFPIFATFVAGQVSGVNFDDQNIDGQRFMPSGVFVDNTSGTAPFVITITNTGFRISCPAGQMMQMPYAAPTSQQVNMEGEGPVSVQFVDFPVIPFITTSAGGTTVTIPDGADIALGAKADAAAADFESVASLISLTKLSIQIDQGVDTAGDPLPANFDSLAQTLTYVAGDLSTIAKTNGANTWTQTYTYTGSDLTGISGWVKT